MNMNPEEFFVLQSGMGAKDVEIARLREEVASLTKERDLWKARALESCPEEVKKVDNRNFIMISVKKLKAVASKIHAVHLLGALNYILQKALPETAGANDCITITNCIPLPQPAQMALNAQGDIVLNKETNIDNNYGPNIEMGGGSLMLPDRCVKQ